MASHLSRSAAAQTIAFSAVMGDGGTIALPLTLRLRLGLISGAPVMVEEREGAILVRSVEPKPSDEQIRDALLEEANRTDAALRADPVAWQEELTERQLWERTLMDGLDPDEVWSESDRVPPDSAESHACSPRPDSHHFTATPARAMGKRGLSHHA